MVMLVMTEDEALELLAFLVPAARTQVDEAPEYAPMRLLTAARRLSEAIMKRVPLATQQVLSEPMAQIAAVESTTVDPDVYREKLDTLCAALSRHLVAHF